MYQVMYVRMLTPNREFTINLHIIVCITDVLEEATISQVGPALRQSHRGLIVILSIAARSSY